MTRIEIPTLRTERLTLRAQTAADFAPFAETLASPRAGWIGTITRREAWSAFCADLAGWQLHGFGHWSVDLRDGTHVGEVGLQHPPYYPEPELGWLLHDGHEGHGYATEAARAARDWARTRLASLVSYVAPGNARSAAVARRLGAVPDETAPRPEGEDLSGTRVWRHWGRAS